ncbi:tape measure protein [Edwardsiella piscicida]
MAGKQLKASIIVDLLGNVSQQARLWSQSLSNMGHRGGLALRGMGSGVRGLGDGLGRLGQQSTRSVGLLHTGLRKAASGFDALEARAGAAYGGVSRLYALMAGGAAIYGMNKWFIDPASRFENYTIGLSSQYKGDQKRVKETLAWAVKNAKDSTWGLDGVMKEYTSSMGFGMSDHQTRQFITMLQDQGAYRGWDLSAAQGASMQLKQMYARQSIQAADANILTGYGINVYQVLAEKLGRDVKQVRQDGEKGKLGPKSIALLFQALREQAKGAQKNAMNSWTGLTAQMGDTWEDFSRRVMDKGPFKVLKGQLRGFLDTYDAADKSGLLDQYATAAAGTFTGLFDRARQGVALFNQGLGKVNATLQQLRDAGFGDVLDKIANGAMTAGKAIIALYVAQKALRIGGAIGGAILRPAWRIGTAPVRYPYRAYRWLRNRKNPAPPGGAVPPLEPFAFPGMGFPSQMNVFVTNWPAGGLGGTGGDIYSTADGKRKRGPGKGRGRGVKVTPAALPAAVKPGVLQRLWRGATGWIGHIPGMGKAGAVGGRILSGISGAARSGLGKVAGLFGGLAGSGLGRALGFGGRLLGRLGGPAMAALSVAPILMDETASSREKSGAVGSVAGGTLGGAIGSLAGPIGTVAGMALGSYLGENLGGWLDGVISKWRGDDAKAQQQPKAEAAVRLIAPEGWGMQSAEVKENGLGLGVDFYTGDNFVSY